MSLTQQQVQELFEYRDGSLYWKKINPMARVKVGDKVGSKNNIDSYWRVGIKQKMYLVHRIIFLYHYGYLPEFVDHKNGDRGDNLIENLRQATKSENCRNAKILKTNTFGVKGVCKPKANKSWNCRLTINGKTKTVGKFESKELASEFIELWREMAHGNFANHGYI